MFINRKHKKSSNLKRSNTLKNMNLSGNNEKMGFVKKYITEEEQRRARLSRQMKCRYGITADDYDAMFNEQLGKCAICNKSWNSQLYDHSINKKKLVIDHNHETGKIRGLLCNNCNFAIGALNENITSLHNAISYLSKSNSLIETQEMINSGQLDKSLDTLFKDNIAVIPNK